MCGIFVVFSKKGNPLPKKKCLSASNELYNRGPDFFKYTFLRKKTLYISNNILSITGKTNINKSVLFSKNKNFYISFNGEIYNYETLCKSYLQKVKLTNDTTDTEILINLYENLNSNLIPKLLNGMFAYVMYDKLKDKLTIVNDVQGEKNLYYYDDDNILLISSTIQAILNFRKKFRINMEPIKNYFITRHFMPHNYTCFNDIKTFNTGSIIDYSLSNNNFKNTVYDNPYDWISENKYLKYNKMKEQDLINYFDYELNI